MNNPRLSFIVPSYNFAAHVSECVESILRQSIKDIEVIVVNDGSSDNTAEILEHLASLDERIKPINKINEGVSIARNTGLLAAKGKYVSFVDADDYLAPEYAEYMLQLCKVNNSEFCLSLDAFTHKGEQQVTSDSVKVLTPEDATALLLSPRIIVGCWNKIYKRQWLIDSNLLFSSELYYGEGLQFITRAAQLSSSVTVGSKKVYYYRRNNYNSATTKFSIDKMYNGLKSLDVIRNSITKSSSSVDVMWRLHRTLFCMGAVVRIEAGSKKKEYDKEYKEWLSYVRKQTSSLVKEKEVPLYRKLLLIGASISPKMMSYLDLKRRERIAEKSV